MEDTSASSHLRHGSVAEQEQRTRVKLPKKLIICCDGTWMNSENSQQIPSNVTRITRAIAAEDDGHHPQVVYYQAGIGTGIGLMNHILGGGTGLGFAENIREAYTFLANNYAQNDPLCANDSIFLIGFSRGAYTARSLGGFICALGILKKQAMEYFYDIFQDWEMAGDAQYKPAFFDKYFDFHPDIKKVSPPAEWARDKTRRDKYLEKYFDLLFQLDLTQHAEIRCIGVWDTVGALGIPVNPWLQRVFRLPSFIRDYSWFDTRLDSSIKNAFQALALGERRSPYSPAVWERQPGCTTFVKQVWFPGAHSNIGGAYEDTGMANITLAWMMDQLSGSSRPADQEFHTHEWIKFSDGWIDDWYHHQARFYEKNHSPQYSGWAQGKIYDSLTFPQSLAGRSNRTPGLYHRTTYETGRIDPDHLLHDTNEYIHACVRLRLEFGGHALEPDWAQVFPRGVNLTPLFKHFWRKLTRRPSPSYHPTDRKQPLDGWKLLDGHSSHDVPNMDIDMDSDGLEEVQWVYTGAKACENKIMPEDRLGPYERQLLAKDVAVAGKVEFTNNGWHVVKQPLPTSTRKGKTF